MAILDLGAAAAEPAPLNIHVTLSRAFSSPFNARHKTFRRLGLHGYLRR